VFRAVVTAHANGIPEELPFGPGWPKFIFKDQVARSLMPSVREWFGEFDVLLLGADDEIAAGGWGVPLAWSGRIPELPAGWDGALEAAVAGRRDGVEPDTLCAMATEVVAGARGRGASSEVLMALRAAAAANGFERMIAPARPVLKHRYPLVDIERYAGWTDARGMPFDPWLRIHAALGARILASVEEGMRILAPVAEWEEMTGMRFPESGEYVVPEALTTVLIDRERDVGTYVEPAVWVQHSL
jgi:hypothetical protein